MTPNIQPRNGHIIVRLIRSETSLIQLPDGAVADSPGDCVEIVAVAPDVPTMPKSNEPMFRIGDAVIGLPGQNIIMLVGTDFGVIHHTAIVAIDKR